jgi:sugar (pentulose or hexulose) kinase
VAAAIGSRIDVLRLAGSPVDEVRVAGGGARLEVMGQVKADLFGVPVVHLAHDTTAMGVAMLAASAAGHADAAREAIAASVGAGRRFEQSSRAVDVMAQRQRWYRSVRPSPAVHRLVET